MEQLLGFYLVRGKIVRRSSFLKGVKKCIAVSQKWFYLYKRWQNAKARLILNLWVVGWAGGAGGSSPGRQAGEQFARSSRKAVVESDTGGCAAQPLSFLSPLFFYLLQATHLTSPSAIFFQVPP